MSRRPGPLLPAGAGAGTLVSLVLVLMVAVGALATVLGAAQARILEGLGPANSRAITVVVWGVGLESADAAAARAREIVAAVAGVTSATALDPSESDAVEAQMVGAPAGVEVRRVAVEASGPGQNLDIAKALAGQSLPARIDDHAWRDSPGLRAGALNALVAVVVSLLALGAFLWVCATRARREAAARADAIEVTRRLGAKDGYFTGLIQRRISGQALTAACFGVAIAVAAGAVWTRYGQAEAWRPLASLTLPELAWAALWIPLAGLAAFIAAGRAMRAIPRPWP